MRKYAWFTTLLCLLLSALLLLMLGCSKGKKEAPMPEPEFKSFAKSEQLDVAVYLDGTFSMAGYVNSPASTVYTNAIREIERTVTGAWKQETIQYLRFGDSFQKLNREQFLGFDKVNFYEQKDTSLQKVVDAVDDGKLNIIITDLFQTDQDIESLLASLKRKSFSNSDKGLAIIGIKSQFNGTIYDVGKARSNFTYTSKDKEGYRPFYLLVLGKEDDLRFFVNQYRKNLGDESKAVLLSKNLGVENGLSLGSEPPRQPGQKRDEAKLMATINTLVKSNRVVQYRLRLDEPASKAYLKLSAKGLVGQVPQDYFMEVASLEKWEQGAFQKLGGENFLKAEVRPDTIKIDGSNLALDLVLRVNPLGVNKREGKYKAELALRPSKGSYMEGIAVFDDWSFSDMDVQGGNLQSFGNKTLNVSTFVRMLGGVNYEVNRPGFYGLPVYLDGIK